VTQLDSNEESFLKQHKAALQTIALVLILVMPFVLYIFAQAGQGVLVTALIILMALMMVAIVIIS
jgi:hypothetical protein